jgi:hypothetical protein
MTPAHSVLEEGREQVPEAHRRIARGPGEAEKSRLEEAVRSR